MTFIDTWAWVALADRSDPYHRQATAQHKKLRGAKRRYVTTDYVLGEAITFLYPAIGSVQAQSFINALLAPAYGFAPAHEQHVIRHPDPLPIGARFSTEPPNSSVRLL